MMGTMDANIMNRSSFSAKPMYRACITQSQKQIGRERERERERERYQLL